RPTLRAAPSPRASRWWTTSNRGSDAAASANTVAVPSREPSSMSRARQRGSLCACNEAIAAGAKAATSRPGTIIVTSGSTSRSYGRRRPRARAGVSAPAVRAYRVAMRSSPTPTTQWLLDSDPSLRWQVERDLLDAPEQVWSATRSKVATEGFGAAILARQDADRRWAGGAYFPSEGFAGDGAIQRTAGAQPWIATTWALKDLRDLGLDAAVLAGTAERLAESCRWDYEDLPYWGGEVDVCINAFTLATGAWLGADVSALAAWFPAHRPEDGGWNCEAEEGDSVRSSFHSTLNAVVEMLTYERI